MHNPFKKHPEDNAGETWWEHCKFSVSIGFRLLLTSLYFIIHGFFPFIEINRKYNLIDSSNWLFDKNMNREIKKDKKSEEVESGWVHKVRRK